jgi:hypothetical protein
MQMQNAPTSTSMGVASVFGRSGTVSAAIGDYMTAQVTESGNLYFTNARALAAVTWAGLTGKPTGFTPLSHASTHQSGGSDPVSLDASQMVSGTLSGSRLPTSALQTTQSNTITAGTQDFSGADHTLPIKVGALAAKPAICKIGETYFASDAAAGANLYGCTAANGWSSLGGTGGSGGSSLAVEASGTLVGNRSSINLIAGVGIQDVLTDTGSQINIQTGLDSAVVQTQPGAQSGSALLCLSTGGHQNNYQCAMQPTLGAYNSGMVLHWVPDVNGAGGITTLNIDTLGTASIKTADGVTDPGATDIVGSRLNSIWYDGTGFRLIATPGQASETVGTACPNGAPAGSVCAVKLYGDGSALTGIATSGASPVVVSLNTATSICSIVSGAGTCTASPTAGASGGPGVIITHNFGKYIEWPVCNQGPDGSGALLGSSSAMTSVTDVSPVSNNATTITFSGPTVAQCGISTGAMGSTGPNGPGYAATSATSMAIGSGAQTFTTQRGLAYSAGARARVSSTANGANYTEGVITSYSGTSLVLNVDTTGGSGTHADWNLNLAGSVGQTGPQGPAGTGPGVADPGSNGILYRSSLNTTAPATATNLSALAYAVGGGAAQAQSVTLTPAVTNLIDGVTVCWLPITSNTGASPTLAVNGLAATAVTKLGTSPLAANDLTTTAIACAIYRNSGFQLQNPQTPASGLSSPVTVRTYNTSAYTGIAPSTPVPLTFDTNDYDTNGIHSTSTNSSRFVASSAGYYRFTCAVDTGTSAASQLIQFRLNGSTVVSCGGSSCSFYDGGTNEYRPWSMELHLNANDYLECLYAPSAGTVTPVAGKYHTNATFTQLH